MTRSDWERLGAELSAALRLTKPLVAITFGAVPPPGVAPFDDPMPPPLPDGRTGRVPAGCVFWTRATERSFTTVEADHGNCSVGSLTHGFKTLEQVSGNSDVAAVLDAGWVTADMVAGLPTVSGKPKVVTYGPLADSTVDPDVVLAWLDARQLMVLSDALPGLRVEGKPQCHVVAVAKERQEVAASVGCMLSRVRTGMANTEMTCAIPGARLAEVVERVVRTAAVDAAVGRYAVDDGRRFRPDVPLT
jgi:uncharacterized protein (DUF169 family)